jgi:hypothetical protein
VTVIDLLGLLLVAGVGAVVFRLLSKPHLGLATVLTVHELGKLEASLPSLVSVTVIAHKVEAPENELRKAVEKNLKNGVSYRFLVSKNTASDELQGYYRIFEVLASIAKKTQLVQIQSLPYNWVEVPYIFYEVRDGGSTESRYIAVRGTQALEGITDYYTKVEPGYAQMIAGAVLSDAPYPITIQEEQLARSNVIPITSARR